MPVGGGILLRATPPKTDKVLLNIGANVVVEKTKEDATKFMEARASDLEEDIISDSLPAEPDRAEAGV